MLSLLRVTVFLRTVCFSAQNSVEFSKSPQCLRLLWQSGHLRTACIKFKLNGIPGYGASFYNSKLPQSLRISFTKTSIVKF